MRHNTQVLGQQLHELRKQPFPLSFCASCQVDLPLFVSDELAGMAVDTLYREIAYHLDLCLVCQMEYESLATLTTNSLYGEGWQ